MPNRRLTRNSYKRKIILFGALIFFAIALISTGLAAWLMSSGASEEPSGNVNVGLVTDANLDILQLDIYKVEEYFDQQSGTWATKETKVGDLENLNTFSFSFNSKLSDTEGRVHYGEDENGPESIIMIVRGIVSPKEVLSDVTISLVLPESVKKAGYIELPDCAKKPVVLTEANGKLHPVEGDETKVAFEYSVEFKWGPTFGGMNPGIYFDTLSESAYSIDQAKSDLQRFRAYMYGYAYDQSETNAELLEKEPQTYSLIINANIK